VLTVADLVADPALQLAVVAGHGGLDRGIEAAAVSELAEPGPWLQGGELLLTIGLLLDESDAGCAAYVDGLVSAGVRALGVGLGADLRYRAAPDRLVRAADHAGLPLLTVPDGVPFIAVTKAVFAWRAREERRQLEWALHTQRALTAAAVQPGGLVGILGAYERATERRARVVDLLERPVAGTGPDPAGFADLIARVRPQGLLGAAVDAGAQHRREVHPLGSRRLRAWLLLAGAAGRPSTNLVTGDLVSLLSLELERMHGLGATAQRARAQVLARLARGTVDDLVAARRLAAVGLPDGDMRAAVVAAPHAEDLAADLAGALPDALTRIVEIGATAADERAVEVAVPAAVDVAAVLRTLAPACPAGIGLGVRPGALAVSLRQARSALPESRISGRHVHAADIASSRQLLAAVAGERLQAYADAVLGPLDALGRSEEGARERVSATAPVRSVGRAQRDRAAELLRTLAAFLEHNGHWESAAAALQVHRHTVRNRMATVEELTGRRLGSAQDRQELWLALRARDLARTSDG
jgi:PucR family transcriptional regulator, purine catabolism regulatory protein